MSDKLREQSICSFRYLVADKKANLVLIATTDNLLIDGFYDGCEGGKRRLNDSSVLMTVRHEHQTLN